MAAATGIDPHKVTRLEEQAREERERKATKKREKKQQKQADASGRRLWSRGESKPASAAYGYEVAEVEGSGWVAELEGPMGGGKYGGVRGGGVIAELKVGKGQGFGMPSMIAELEGPSRDIKVDTKFDLKVQEPGIPFTVADLGDNLRDTKLGSNTVEQLNNSPQIHDDDQQPRVITTTSETENATLSAYPLIENTKTKEYRWSTRQESAVPDTHLPIKVSAGPGWENYVSPPYAASTPSISSQTSPPSPPPSSALTVRPSVAQPILGTITDIYDTAMLCTIRRIEATPSVANDTNSSDVMPILLAQVKKYIDSVELTPAPQHQYNLEQWQHDQHNFQSGKGSILNALIGIEKAWEGYKKDDEVERMRREYKEKERLWVNHLRKKDFDMDSERYRLNERIKELEARLADDGMKQSQTQTDVVEKSTQVIIITDNNSNVD